MLVVFARLREQNLGMSSRVHHEVRRTITSVEDDVTFGELEVSKRSDTPDLEQCLGGNAVGDRDSP